MKQLLTWFAASLAIASLALMVWAGSVVQGMGW